MRKARQPCSGNIFVGGAVPCCSSHPGTLCGPPAHLNLTGLIHHGPSLPAPRLFHTPPQTWVMSPRPCVVGLIFFCSLPFALQVDVSSGPGKDAFSGEASWTNSRAVRGTRPKCRIRAQAPTGVRQSLTGRTFPRSAGTCCGGARAGHGGRPPPRAGSFAPEGLPRPAGHPRGSHRGMGAALVECAFCRSAAGSRWHGFGQPLQQEAGAGPPLDGILHHAAPEGRSCLPLRRQGVVSTRRGRRPRKECGPTLRPLLFRACQQHAGGE